MSRQLIWFRSDLRVVDNPALSAAMQAGETVAVFVISTGQWRAHGVGDSRLSFLLRCLAALAIELRALGVPLRILDVPMFAGAATALERLMSEVDAHALYFNAEYPLDEHRRDAAVGQQVAATGKQVFIHHGHVLMPPGSVVTAAGSPYTVFTPFKRRLLERLQPDALRPQPPPVPQRSCTLASDAVPPSIDGVDANRLGDIWPGGSLEAQRRLQRFVDEDLRGYDVDRDRPDLDATSRLSAYLAVGAISVRTCASAARDRAAQSVWESELIWREFYQHVIAAFAHVSMGASFKRHYDDLDWRSDPVGLAAWQAGRTGYPLVDAGMRQLAATGWMHNRLRMVTAMFLTKHLLIDWREGERHFMAQLVDGDFAANNGGWQWSASTGTDAVPYFRVFNPVTQAKKCDPKGAFVRQWVPELAGADIKTVFEPWRSPLLVPDYPARIVDHAAARSRAIEAFKQISSPSDGAA